MISINIQCIIILEKSVSVFFKSWSKVLFNNLRFFLLLNAQIYLYLLLYLKSIWMLILSPGNNFLKKNFMCNVSIWIFLCLVKNVNRKEKPFHECNKLLILVMLLYKNVEV